ncbi:sensor histidine kinase [Alkalihalobacillus pseudalcaliphilus]|uniref:sensor histidine kinase n=1 Tax=Alkalihalobacillus pseudalcaliphilus TaxID=79884 RepID=UPI00064DCBCC|nr:sensor histidine kinase [Alkalihalobacillus pseudalcaliphilus]KMK78079.1 membrane protein [Alkalihalobacillus pseudalcaliphilus]
MMLFLREYKSLLLMQLLQYTVIFSIFWLAGYRDWLLLFYSLFLGFVILIVYIFYYYFTRKSYYKRLQTPFQSLDESYAHTNTTPISNAFDERVKEQYQFYREKLKELEGQQEEQLKFMNQWVHQMKTPLSVVQLMSEEMDEPYASDLRAETDRIKQGLDTVLYMSRLSTIEQDFHVEEIKLTSLIREVMNEHRRYFIRHQVYPKLHTTKEPIIVKSDEKWLYFILVQVILNAVKYSAEQSSKLDLALYDRDADLVLEVCDYGIGIPASDRERIFDPFFTGENGRKFRESTGMGLYLVKEVTSFLGHRLEVETEVGKGTSFRIIFSETQYLTLM